MQKELYGLTVIQLRERLKALSLVTGGIKNVLVNRLLDYYESHPEATDETTTSSSTADSKENTNSDANKPSSADDVPPSSSSYSAASTGTTATTTTTAAAATTTTTSSSAAATCTSSTSSGGKTSKGDEEGGPTTRSRSAAAARTKSGSKGKGKGKGRSKKSKKSSGSDEDDSENYSESGSEGASESGSGSDSAEESDAESSGSGSDSDEEVHRKRKPTRGASGDSTDAKKPRSSAQKTSRWIKFDSLLLYSSRDDIAPSTTIYGFDMDDTLIATKSGKKFATGRSDWKWFHKCVPDALRKLVSDGKKVVIFTNQGGICGRNGYDKSKEAMITGKIEDIIAELNLPIQVLIATTEDMYRKPGTELWKIFVEKLNGGVAPNLPECTFVGDAAGRPKNWAPGKKEDFSCSDRKFAFNLGIKFATPEVFFLGQQDVPFDWDYPDLSKIPETGPIIDGNADTLTSATTEMILFVGFPASGKSTFAKTHLIPKNYVHVNRDTLSTQPKCLKAAKDALSSGSSVVIDNTNPSKANRAPYIKLAKDLGVPVRCFRFDTEEELAKHLNSFREQITQGKSAHVPRVGYAVFKKAFQEPTLSEGFSEIRHINFVANFASPEHRAVFKLMH
ncbi:DNA 3'phosphatase [Pelomyxa schiedti]|nr:DNA 3'phosphatase [Pelomyxa schiedti]